jgi:hypothetical protein
LHSAVSGTQLPSPQSSWPAHPPLELDDAAEELDDDADALLALPVLDEEPLDDVAVEDAWLTEPSAPPAPASPPSPRGAPPSPPAPPFPFHAPPLVRPSAQAAITAIATRREDQRAMETRSRRSTWPAAYPAVSAAAASS